MRALLNRTKDFPSKQSYKIHRIVMFTPLTENVSLDRSPGLVKLLGSQSKDINQMQANNYSELGKVKEDLKSLLDPHDVVSETRKERFLKNVADRRFDMNAEADELDDVWANG